MTNKPKVFQKTRVTETGISDYHKLVSRSFKSHYSRLKAKVSYYRNYKNFDEHRFLNDLENTNFISISEDPDERYDYLTTKFPEVVDKHAPLKKKFVRGNQAPFMNKELRKAIYNRSRLKNKFCKNETKENEEIYRKQRNKCVKLRKKSIKLYFSKITQNGIVTNKNFWKVIKPFLTNKGCIDGNEISIVNGDEIISDEKELVKTFNEHYINIVERSCGVKSQNLFQEGTSAHLTDTEKIDIIEKHYESHPSIIEIKNNLKPSHDLNISTFQTNPSEVKKLIMSLDTKKATGVDKIPPKLVKLAADVLATPLSLAINSSIDKGAFPDAAKVASVSLVDKKTDDKNKISNFRPVSVLNTFSKVYEIIIKNHLVSIMNNHFSPYIAAYRENYSCQHVLLRLIEEWRLKLDNDYVVEAL